MPFARPGAKPGRAAEGPPTAGFSALFCRRPLCRPNGLYLIAGRPAPAKIGWAFPSLPVRAAEGPPTTGFSAFCRRPLCRPNGLYLIAGRPAPAKIGWAFPSLPVGPRRALLQRAFPLFVGGRSAGRILLTEAAFSAICAWIAPSPFR